MKTGFGIVSQVRDRVSHVGHGVIFLHDEKDFPSRLSALYVYLNQVITKYNPDVIAVENVFLGKNPDSAFKLGHARGVVLCAAALQKIPTVEYATRLVKKGVAGSGAATKENVAIALKHQLRLEKIVNDDASDALALAVFHCQKHLSQMRMREVTL